MDARFAALLGFLLMTAVPGAPAAALTIGGPFTLTTPDGRTVTEQTFRGAWLLVYFGYTSCPESCPTALVSIARALVDLGPKAAQLRAIFVTIDPLHDTKARMGEYTSSFDPRILGLSGTPEQIEQASKAYGVYVVPHVSGSEPQGIVLDHSTYIYLMSPLGRFVRAFDPSWSGHQIADAVRDAMGRSGEPDLASSAKPK